MTLGRALCLALSLSLPIPAFAADSPERHGTPAASAKAAPAWWTRPVRYLNPGEVAYAPDSPEAAMLYDKARAVALSTGPLRDVALACHVDLGSIRFDPAIPFMPSSMELGDITVTAWIEGKGPRHAVVGDGPEDRNSALFLLPDVSLDVGGAIGLRLIDRDIEFDDFIETIRLRYTGTTPIPIKTRVTTGECRVVTREALEPLVAGHLAAADKELEKAAGLLRPDPFAAQPKSVDDLLQPARTALTSAASLVGWDDPRVVDGMARATEAEKKFEEAWGAAFDQVHATAIGRDWTPMAYGQLEVRGVALRCGDKALMPYTGLFELPRFRPKDACAVNVAVRNKTLDELEVGMKGVGPLTELVLIDRRGTLMGANIAGRFVKGRAYDLPSNATLGAAKEAEYVVLPPLELPRESRGPVLLRASPGVHIAPKGAKTIAIDGRVSLEVLEFSCGDPAFEPLASLAFVPSWERPLCGLKATVENRSQETQSLGGFERGLFIMEGTWETKNSALVVLGDAPRRLESQESLAAGAKKTVMALFHLRAPVKREELRLGVPGKRDVVFIDPNPPPAPKAEKP